MMICFGAKNNVKCFSKMREMGMKNFVKSLEQNIISYFGVIVSYRVQGALLYMAWQP